MTRVKCKKCGKIISPLGLASHYNSKHKEQIKNKFQRKLEVNDEQTTI